MNSKALTLSIIMAVLALFFVNSYVTSVEDEAKKKFGTEVLVIVAKKDIKEMDTILETMVEFVPIPKRFLEPAAISLEKKEGDTGAKEGIRTLKGLVGNIAVVPIKKGEQITFNKITDPGIRTGLAPQIAPGRRAIAIPVSEKSAVGKLIKPGDRVDLIAMIDMGGGKENKMAKTILQDVVVLSIGRYVTNNVARVIEADQYSGAQRVKSLTEDFSYSSITVEVDPTQAQILTLVMNSDDNAITLSLRNNEDNDRTNIAGTVLTDVLGPDAARIKIGQAGRK
jgi:pilus assembly protein CpaB